MALRVPIPLLDHKTFHASLGPAPEFDDILFVTGALVSFCGLLRVGEFACPTKSGLKKGLLPEHIRFHPDHVDILLEDCKTV